MDMAALPYLEQIRAVMPGPFAGVCAPDSKITLGEISRGLRSMAPSPAPQDAHDLIALAAGDAARLLGHSAGAALARTLEASFVVTTANHHGLDTHPEFLQGVIVFALDRLMGAASAAEAVPVLSTGEVPMSNIAFPQGIFLGRPKQEDSAAYHRFNVFKPDSRKTLVSLQPPFTPEDVARAQASVAHKHFLAFERKIAKALLAEICGCPEVLKRKSYAEQATVFNALLWPRLFSGRENLPRLIELDKAELARRLIIKDILDKKSLIHALLFEPAARRALLAALNRTLGCWTCPEEGGWSKLEQGTIFFWGIDPKGRAFPLGLNAENTLVSSAYAEFSLQLTPADLSAALEHKRILPGLYLSFVAVAIARGLNCCGGAYQTGYLVDMSRRTAAALKNAGEASLAGLIEALPAAPMTTGLMPLRFHSGGETPYPAGPVEIIAASGLTAAHLEGMAQVPAIEAFRLYLSAHYEDIIPPGRRIPEWAQHLAPCGGVVLGPAAGERR